MKKTGIIFDLDGTLWDSAEGVARAWNEIMQEYDDLDIHVTIEDVHSVMGMLLPQIARVVMPNVPDDYRTKVFDRCMAYENEYLEQHGGVLYPKLRETLETLRKKGFLLFIVSNCQCGYIEAFLNYHQLWDCFDGILSAGDTGEPKWCNISTVVRKYALERAVYLGDVCGDYKATVKAGLPFIHAAYGFGSVPEGTIKIDAFEELIDVVEQAFTGGYMTGKQKMTGVVLSQECLCPGIYSMVVRAEAIARHAQAGQFVSVYCKDQAHLLPRPISLCEIDYAQGTLRLVYRVAGFGTDEFSRYQSGDSIELMGPLGNGFSLDNNKKAFLIGGGIGIPPMLQVAKTLSKNGMPKENILAVLGYRDVLFLKEDFEPYATVFVATEDGSAGTKGNVLDAISENELAADVIYACGPTPMLRAIKAYAEANNICCYVSMEERMACGIGACLACVCQSKEVDAHTHVHNKRICKDGPVFLASEVEL